LCSVTFFVKYAENPLKSKGVSQKVVPEPLKNVTPKRNLEKSGKIQKTSKTFSRALDFEPFFRVQNCPKKSRFFSKKVEKKCQKRRRPYKIEGSKNSIFFDFFSKKRNFPVS
jgi:hypothetical protein